MFSVTNYIPEVNENDRLNILRAAKKQTMREMETSSAFCGFKMDLFDLRVS
jgi:hypothetical protein